jgi:hypothetical protein
MGGFASSYQMQSGKIDFYLQIKINGFNLQG